MFDSEQGRAEARAPRPGDTHYRMSETTHLHWQMFAATLQSLSILTTRMPDDPGTGFEDHHAAPLFHLLADYAERLIEDCVVAQAGARQ